VHAKAFGGKQYHIACGQGDLAEYLLVPGDPDRVPKIANFWDSAKEVSRNREFRSFTGKYWGLPISALSITTKVRTNSNLAQAKNAPSKLPTKPHEYSTNGTTRRGKTRNPAFSPHF
jgi:hypothetical protein